MNWWMEVTLRLSPSQFFFRHYELVDFGKDFRKEVFLLQRFLREIEVCCSKSLGSERVGNVYFI